MKKRQKKKPESAAIQVTAAIDRGVPKLANIVNFAKINDNLLLTFIFAEMQKDGVQTGTVIERIIVDRVHAKEMVEIMNRMLSSS